MHYLSQVCEKRVETYSSSFYCEISCCNITVSFWKQKKYKHSFVDYKETLSVIINDQVIEGLTNISKNQIIVKYARSITSVLSSLWITPTTGTLMANFATSLSNIKRQSSCQINGLLLDYCSVRLLYAGFLSINSNGFLNTNTFPVSYVFHWTTYLEFDCWCV